MWVSYMVSDPLAKQNPEAPSTPVQLTEVLLIVMAFLSEMMIQPTPELIANSNSTFLRITLDYVK